jgi:hypothetical protein
MEKLKKAYPDFIIDVEYNSILFKDSTRMVFDDSFEVKDFYTYNNLADLEDMFLYPYPKGMPYDTPLVRISPGTIRCEPFFKKMYGETKEDIEKNLVKVPWLPGVTKRDHYLMVTSVNGVADKVKAISDEFLEKPELHPYLTPPGGGFNYRYIAGTTQLSNHSFGIAIDICTKYSNYWRWEKQDTTTGYINYVNRIPLEIVEVFEKHGFIWGGKWYNYDTMHFEYRPEMFL